MIAGLAGVCSNLKTELIPKGGSLSQARSQLANRFVNAQGTSEDGCLPARKGAAHILAKFLGFVSSFAAGKSIAAALSREHS